MIINILQIYIDILVNFRQKSSPSDSHRLPPLHYPHISMDLLEFLGILRVYGDQNIGIDRLDRILEVAFAGVA